MARRIVLLGLLAVAVACAGLAAFVLTVPGYEAEHGCLSQTFSDLTCTAPAAPSSGYCLIPGLGETQCNAVCEDALHIDCWIQTTSLNPLQWLGFVGNLLGYGLCLTVSLLIEAFTWLVQAGTAVIVWLVSAPFSLFGYLAGGFLWAVSIVQSGIMSLGLAAPIASVLAGSFLLVVALVLVWLGVTGVRNVIDLL